MSTIKAKSDGLPRPSYAILILLAALAGCQRSAVPPASASPTKPARGMSATVMAAQAAVANERGAAPERVEQAQPNIDSQPVDAALAEDAVALVDDNATLLLRERLSPPKQATVPPLPGSFEPQPRGPGPADLLTLPLTKLPLADVSKTPSVLPLERPQTPFAHPALDVPPLAFSREPERPGAPKLLLGPRAYVASADSKRMPPLPPFPRDSEPAVLVSDDPSADATRRVITAPLPLPAPALPPPLRLSIPDPFEHARAVELRIATPDADRPAFSHVRPVRPLLTPLVPKP